MVLIELNLAAMIVPINKTGDFIFSLRSFGFYEDANL
jgi:hypothetical protein